MGRTWTRYYKHARFFANGASLSFLSLPAHDEALASDTLYTIQFNHEWRELVAGALQFYFTHYNSELGFDNEDLLSAAILDLYNAETFTMRKFRLENVDIVSNQSQTSGTAAMVTNSNFMHTFEYTNAIIRCYGICLVGTIAASVATAIVELQGEIADERADAISEGVDPRELVAVCAYSNLPTGTPIRVSLTLGSLGGQSTIRANSRLLYEIEEWD